MYALHTGCRETASGTDEPRKYCDMSDGTKVPGVSNSQVKTREAVLWAFFDTMLTEWRTEAEQLRLLQDLFSKFSVEAQSIVLGEVRR